MIRHDGAEFTLKEFLIGSPFMLRWFVQDGGRAVVIFDASSQAIEIVRMKTAAQGSFPEFVSPLTK